MKKGKVAALVGVGCAGLIVLIFVFVGVLMTVVMGGMKSSEVYKGALERAEQNAEVVAHTGQPIEPGLFLTGGMSTSGPSGSADISIPISGPKGEGTLYVVATKSAGQWNFDQLIFEADEGARLDLLE